MSPPNHNWDAGLKTASSLPPVTAPAVLLRDQARLNSDLQSNLHVFVYGTLKPGERNHWVCRDWVVRALRAIVPGQLYALPLGYPALTPGTAPIQGTLLSFLDPTILLTLDAFEQHDPEHFGRSRPGLLVEEHQYRRQLVEVFEQDWQAIGTAWAYTMELSQVQRLGGILLPDGCWTDEQQQSLFTEADPQGESQHFFQE